MYGASNLTPAKIRICTGLGGRTIFRATRVWSLGYFWLLVFISTLFFCWKCALYHFLIFNVKGTLHRYVSGVHMCFLKLIDKFIHHMSLVQYVPRCPAFVCHYNDVIMCVMASQITSLTIVYFIVYSGADKRKHQSSASLAFVRGIHRRPVNAPHKGPVTRKMLPFDDVIMFSVGYVINVFTYINHNYSQALRQSYDCHSISDTILKKNWVNWSHEFNNDWLYIIWLLFICICQGSFLS